MAHNWCYKYADDPWEKKVANTCQINPVPFSWPRSVPWSPSSLTLFRKSLSIITNLFWGPTLSSVYSLLVSPTFNDILCSHTLFSMLLCYGLPSLHHNSGKMCERSLLFFLTHCCLFHALHLGMCCDYSIVPLLSWLAPEFLTKVTLQLPSAYKLLSLTCNMHSTHHEFLPLDSLAHLWLLATPELSLLCYFSTTFSLLV